MPEAWLRGPIDGIPPLLMPAAHCLVDAVADIEGAVEHLVASDVWLRPGGAAAIGFHIRHICGSLDRLLTYARGEQLTSRQLAELAAENEPREPPEPLDELLADLRASCERALNVYRSTNQGSLLDPRSVGRARLPSTVLGLLFHAAEHSRRHAGQIVATARIINGLKLDGASSA